MTRRGAVTATAVTYTPLLDRLIADATAAGYTVTEGEGSTLNLRKPRRKYVIRTVPGELTGARCFHHAARTLRTGRKVGWGETLHLRHDMGLAGGCPCNGGQS